MLKRKIIILTSFVFLLCSSLTAFASEPNDVEGFVERLYGTCLSRSSDEEGLNYWADLLSARQKSAAEVVFEFYGSKEYQIMNVSDADFVESLYYTMMDRGSDDTGLAYWLDVLSTGVSRDYIISGFVGSQEFSNICSDYNVEQGSITLTEARDININTTKFIQRLYNTCLGRTADVGGLNYWCGYVNSGEMTGAILSLRFFESVEYQNMDKDNTVYIEDLYNTLMDRDADTEGLSYWEAQLSYGYSRKQILKQFAESEEFTLICSDYGINRGTIEASNYELSEMQQLIMLINEERAKNGLSKLIVDIYSNAYASAHLWYEFTIKNSDEDIGYSNYIDCYTKELNLAPDNNRIYSIMNSPEPYTTVDFNSVGEFAAKAFSQINSSEYSRYCLWSSDSARYTKIGISNYVAPSEDGPGVQRSEDGMIDVYWVLVLSYEDDTQ